MILSLDKKNKHKNCHEKKEGSTKRSSKGLMYLILFAIFFAIAIYSFYNASQSPSGPRGEAPPGKVWSEEHQHYH